MVFTGRDYEFRLALFRVSCCVGTHLEALALLLLGVSAVDLGVNQWTGQGLSGSKVRVLAIDPQVPITFYARTEEEGIFKSTDCRCG